MSTFLRFFFFILGSCSIFFFQGCGKTKGSNTYEVAFDPLWYPLNFKDKTNNVIGFSTELLALIAEKEDISLSLLSTNWDDLLLGLKNQKYQGVLCSLFPYNFNKSQYDFSETYLPLGPVLLLPTSSPFSSLEELEGKEIGVMAGSSSLAIAKRVPSLYIRTYEKDSILIQDLLLGKIQGGLLPLIPAESFVQGAFSKEIKIASPPLNAEGLRLLTLKGQNTVLIKQFDHALKALKKENTYQLLLRKWELINELPN